MDSNSDDFQMSSYLQNLTPIDMTQDQHRLQHQPFPSSYQYNPLDPFPSDTLAFQLPSFLLGAPTPVPGGGADVIPGSAGSVNFGHWMGGGDMFQDFVKPSSSLNDDISCTKYLQLNQSTEDVQYLPPAQDPPHNAPFNYSAPGPPPELDYTPPTLPPPPSSPPPRPQIESIANQLPTLSPTVHLTGPSAPPLYSTTGFDMLGILARVANRLNPTVILGPVDLSCSFVVVDVRRYDHPIVYASPTFFKLTGYEATEVIGRNCRFLQSPDGQVQQGSPRTFTDEKAVAHLKKSLVAGKECQANLMNYRKGGIPFLNLVSVIPIPWDDGRPDGSAYSSGEIRYHVGFQVDLVHQPNAILQTMKDGTYLVNYSTATLAPSAGLTPAISGSTYPLVPRDHDRRKGGLTAAQRKLLNSLSPPEKDAAGSQEVAVKKNDEQMLQDFNTMLLENTHDFIHVLSVKGVIQYFSPSLLRALEYTSEEIIGRPISHIAHPQDLTPVSRELKDASSSNAEGSAGSNAPPRMVHLMFRVRRKRSGMVWLESSGRLHVEPGKTRKSIIFSGRIRELPTFTWGSVSLAGGLAGRSIETGASPEIWMKISLGTLLIIWSSESGVEDLVGLRKEDVVGTPLVDYAGSPETLETLKGALEQARANQEQSQDVRETISPVLTSFSFTHQQTKQVSFVDVAIYPATSIPTYHNPVSPQAAISPQSTISSSQLEPPESTADPGKPKPSSVICQFKAAQTFPSSLTTRRSSIVHALNSKVYEELDATRGTNWNYELETVRQSNDKIKADLDAIASGSSKRLSGYGSRRGSLADNTSPTNESGAQKHPRSLSPSPAEQESDRKRLRFDDSPRFSR